MRSQFPVAGLTAVLVILAGCGDSRPITSLIAAAREGETAAIRALIQSGADPNERGGVNDWTPLMHAIHKNQYRAVIALLDDGADPNAKTRSGNTALIMAAGY